MSGTIVVRCPTALHAELLAEAERQGVSLNNLCVSLLAGGIHFKLPKGRKVKVERMKNISTTCKHGHVFCAVCCFATEGIENA